MFGVIVITPSASTKIGPVVIGVTFVVLVVAVTPAKTSLFIKLPGNTVGKAGLVIGADIMSLFATKVLVTLITAVVDEQFVVELALPAELASHIS